jgi:hypothetical protein
MTASLEVGKSILNWTWMVPFASLEARLGQNGD